MRQLAVQNRESHQTEHSVFVGGKGEGRPHGRAGPCPLTSLPGRPVTPVSPNRQEVSGRLSRRPLGPPSLPAKAHLRPSLFGREVTFLPSSASCLRPIFPWGEGKAVFFCAIGTLASPPLLQPHTLSPSPSLAPVTDRSQPISKPIAVFPRHKLACWRPRSGLAVCLLWP